MALRMTEEEYRAFEQRRRQRAPEQPEMRPQEPQKSKYHNRRVEMGGMKFDSRHEAQTYAELQMRVMAGELKTILRQVSFDLPGGIRYIADFVTVDRENRIEVLDAKSPATAKNRTYINKKKQMKKCLGLEIVEV